MSVSPVVAVWMVTYNHEQFIAQAIESVICQQTTFPIKLFIGEDCSTDNTRQICLAYQQQYPELIELFLNDKNLGPTTNALQIYDACFKSQSKYLAMLEGDDYWTDEYKLQQQVDYMEAYPEYSLCFHWADMLYQDTGSIESSGLGPPIQKSKYTIDDLLRYTVFIPTCSTMFRSSALRQQIPGWFSETVMGDFILYVLLAQQGNFGFLDKSMGVYRVHRGGICGGRGGVPGGTTAIANLQRALHTYALVDEHLGVGVRASYRCAVANMQIYLYRAYKKQGKYVRGLMAGYHALKIAPDDLRKHILVHNRCYSPLLQVLRIIRIHSLGLVKRGCGEARYNKLKALIRS